jgi:hypothetical protein
VATLSRLGSLVGAAVLVPVVAAAQGYQARIDTRMQTAAFRGVLLDSVAVGQTTSLPGTGPVSPDGFAVRCAPAAAYCTFFRPGPIRRSSPVTTTATVTAWGVGLPGLSAHAVARVGFDVAEHALWPGTDPLLQLLEGYAEYVVPRVTGRLGRQVVASRLGSVGFDGAALVMRDRRSGLEVRGYAGWGLARGIALPITSPVLNPLDEFRPERRQLVAGANAGWHAAVADARVDYLREVDPRSDYFVSERLGLQGVLRPARGLTVAAGADYDLASGWWGSAEASVAYAHRYVQALVGARRYRPHFELWSVWSAFSPVAYRAGEASLGVTATSWIHLRARYERYEYEPSETNTPLYSVEEDGWRWEVGGTVTPVAGLTVDGVYRREFGPGAASAGFAGNASYAPSRRVSVSVLASSLNRPLEFRYNEAVVRCYGVDATVAPSARIQLGLNVLRYAQEHRRPDAGAYEWDQVRASARVAFLLGAGGDHAALPPAIRLLPGDRAAR